MFGSGASIVASVHLAKGNVKAARINATQAYAVSTVMMPCVALAVIPMKMGIEGAALIIVLF